MFRFVVVLSVVAVASPVFAQGTASMPGIPVGSSSNVKPVGTRLPSVGTQLPKVGQSLPGYGENAKTPFQGNFPKVDENLVVAPYPSQPKPEDDFWDALQKRFGVLFAGEKQPTPTWTPGIARRNRDRAKEREKQEMLRRMRD